MVTEKNKAEINYKDILFIIILCLILLPIQNNINILSRTMGYSAIDRLFPICAGLIIYFIYAKKTSKEIIFFILIMYILLEKYIRFLPFPTDYIENYSLFSESIGRVHFFIPFFFWCLIGIAFLGKNLSSADKRMEFLKYSIRIFSLYICFLLLIYLFYIFISLFFSNKFNLYNNVKLISQIFILPITFLYDKKIKLIRKFSFYSTKIIMKLIFVIGIILLLNGMMVVHNSGYKIFLMKLFLLNIILIIIYIHFIIERENNSQITKKDRSVYLYIIISIPITFLFLIYYIILGHGFLLNFFSLIPFFHLVLLGISYSKFIKEDCKFNDVRKTIVNFIPVYFIIVNIIIFILPVIFNFK